MTIFSIFQVVIPREMDPSLFENDTNVTKEFHEACKRGNLEKVKNLLNLKEKIEVKQLDEEDTLSEVVINQNADIVKILLALGVNVNKQDNDFITPLHWASALASDLPVAKMLVQNGANLDAVTEGNLTPLWFASDYGNVGAVKLLLENGCNTGIRNHQHGRTALENVMEIRHIDVLKLFVFHGK